MFVKKQTLEHVDLKTNCTLISNSFAILTLLYHVFCIMFELLFIRYLLCLCRFRQ